MPRLITHMTLNIASSTGEEAGLESEVIRGARACQQSHLRSPTCKLKMLRAATLMPTLVFQRFSLHLQMQPLLAQPMPLLILPVHPHLHLHRRLLPRVLRVSRTQCAVSSTKMGRISRWRFSHQHLGHPVRRWYHGSRRPKTQRRESMSATGRDSTYPLRCAS